MKTCWCVLLVAGLILSSSALFSGCAKNNTAAVDEMSPDVMLPKHFVAVKGLDECDFDPEGWPRYIMNCKDGSVMVMVPETIFVMGDTGREVNEKPSHKVAVGRYYIDLYEVNNAQFARFAKAAGCIGPCCKKWKDDPVLANGLLDTTTPECWLKRNGDVAGMKCLKADPVRAPQAVQLDISYFKEYWTPGVNDSHPARAVSYWEAWYYCRWVGKDLPTEAEWELAAKGPKPQMYPWGNIEPDSQHLLCNYDGSRPSEDGFHYTAPVTAFAAGRSPFGCYNMAGNVWEWCKDNYSATAYSVTNFAERTPFYASEANRAFGDPTGPVYGDERVLRGGSYTSVIADCRTTNREGCRPNFHGMNIGFRGVLRVR